MSVHNSDNAFRRKRFSKFLDLLPKKEKVRILDVGGTVEYWKELRTLYGRDDVEITVVNLDVEPHDDQNILFRSGDACNLAEYADMSFDVVHSNSVIEHVGRWSNMRAMAEEVRRLAPRYFVQTPNIWFPIEPHYKLPLVHWLPEQARAAVLQATRKIPKVPLDAPSAVQRTWLLGESHMRSLFPDATLWKERWMGLAKSLVAIRQG